MNRRISLAVLGLLIVCFLSDACGGVHRVITPSDSGVLRVATRQSQASPAAVTDGLLSGTVNRDGTACFYLEGASIRMALWWPAGFSGRQNPLRVIDNHGLIVAKVGDHVTFGGGLSPSPAGAPLLGCGNP